MKKIMNHVFFVCAFTSYLFALEEKKTLITLSWVKPSPWASKDISNDTNKNLLECKKKEGSETQSWFLNKSIELGKKYEKKGDFLSASHFYQQAIHQECFDGYYHLGLMAKYQGLIKESQDNYQNAETFFLQGAKHNKNCKNQLILSAISLITQKKYIEAQYLFESAEKSEFTFNYRVEKPSEKNWLNIGVKYEVQGKLKEAYNSYIKAAQQGLASFYYLGLLAQKKGDNKSALGWFLHGIVNKERNCENQLQNVSINLTDNQIKYSFQKNKNNNQDWLSIGWSYEREEKLEKAYESYKNALNPKGSTYYLACFCLGRVAKKMKLSEEAIDWFKKSSKGTNEYNSIFKSEDFFLEGDMWLKLGDAFKESNDIASAYDCYYKATQQGYSDGYYYLGLLMQSINKNDSAKSYFLQGTVEKNKHCEDQLQINQKNNQAEYSINDKNNSKNWLGIGWSYEKEKKFEKALECYKKALESEDLYHLACFYLGHLRRKMGFTEKAVYWFKEGSTGNQDCTNELIKILKSNGIIMEGNQWVNLGNLYKKSGDIKFAYDCYLKAVKQDYYKTYHYLDLLMHEAICNSNIEMVKFLINEGINVNKKDKGMTPLMWAALINRIDIVKLLINNGATIDQETINCAVTKEIEQLLKRNKF